MLIKCCSSFSGVWDRQTEEVHDKALWWLIPFVAINADSSPPPHRHILDFIRYHSDVCSEYFRRYACPSWKAAWEKAEYFSGYTQWGPRTRYHDCSKYNFVATNYLVSSCWLLKSAWIITCQCPIPLHVCPQTQTMTVHSPFHWQVSPTEVQNHLAPQKARLTIHSMMLILT